MGYLGNTPGESFISFAKQVFTIVNSQTAYTLDFAVVDENELRLVINNVVQEPGSGKAYTASGTTLTLASALTNGTDEMYCVFLGKARETVTVPTITKDKLNLISTSSSAGLEVKGDGTTDGTIQLNCSQNSHGIKLASPPHSAGQSYTLTFPQSISADTFLKTDGSGNLSFASAGGTNTPAFVAYKTSSQSVANTTFTKITFEAEQLDSNSAYDTSNSRFTPGVVGYYFIGATWRYDTTTDFDDARFVLYRNGSAAIQSSVVNKDANGMTFSVIIQSDADDYFEMYGRQDSGGSVNLNHSASYLGDSTQAQFYAFRIIGV